MDIRDFIRRQNLHFSDADFAREAGAFEQEMRRGLEGRESSLKMIPAYISDDSRAVRGGRAVAIDMGGTNLRIATVHFCEDGSIKQEMTRAYAMPGRETRLEKDPFFDILAEYLAPFLQISQNIGLCFSFPCAIRPDLDGVMLGFNKEVGISGVEGESLKENIEAALIRRNDRKPIRLAVVNDTVAAMLGARAQSAGRSFGGYIGFILGTGTNTCYAEKNSRIVKVPGLRNRPGSSLVNLESGGYAHFPRNAPDEAFDRTTRFPGAQILEKMIGGEYQGGLMLAYLREAAAAGCFSQKSRGNLLALPALSGREIGEYFDHAYGDNTLAKALASETDKLAAWRLLDSLFDRSAFIVSMTLAAVMNQSGAARNPLAPLCISAEGSTLRKSRPLRLKTQHYLYEYARKQMGLQYELLFAGNTTLLGSAYAVLAAP